MEYKVLRDNIVLEVVVAVKIKHGITAKTQKINFNECLNFQAKHMTLSLNDYTDNQGRSHATCQNIVLFKIQKTDQADQNTYRVHLSCPQFNIQKRVFYFEESRWHVVDRNSKSTAYAFAVTLIAEALVQPSFSILHNDEIIIDFKLKGKDGEINIHKPFLAALSSVFRSKVYENEINGDSLDIPETSVSTLRDFKKTIYTEVLPDKNLKQLLLLASYFKIKWIETECIDIITNNMSSDDVKNLLEFALKHKHMPLLLGIMDVVHRGGVKVIEISKRHLQL